MLIHSGAAITPPGGPNQVLRNFFLHPRQEDNLLAMQGGDTFFLVNLDRIEIFRIMILECGGDILKIFPDIFHQSISDHDESLVLKTGGS